MLTTSQSNCDTCGRALNAGGIEGLCELCLLESGLRGYDDADASGKPVAPSRWRSIGDYELTAEIARGGMGVVYRARQSSLDREVALKMILVGHWASDAQVERFRLEARASARLDHPHIVPILELGEHEGWHYFTMKLIDGEDLARQMSAGKWPAATRTDQERIARLLEPVAAAVHFAHQRGILHRDLKPTNILIDQAGAPYVTDFGLAKLIEETSEATHSSAVLGTPAYMAPEQAAGRTADITVAADIYSLGAVLYELLGGRPPHRANTPLETIRQVVEQEIAPLPRLNPAVDPDLATLCGKCLRREPGDRYGSAQELADDLGRWLRREPIQARAVTAFEKFGYWVRRNPGTAALSGALLLVILLTAVISSGLAVRMREARDEARLSADENRRRLVSLLVDTGLNAVTSGDPALSLPWLVAALQADAGDPARELPHRTRIASVLNELPELRALWFHDRLIQHAAFSRDGAKAATASYDGTVRVWDTATGAEIGLPRRHTNDGPGLTLLFHVAFSPDGTRIVSAGNLDARVWDVASGRLIVQPLAHSNAVRVASFSPDGLRIMTASIDRTVRVWNAVTGDALTEPLRHEAGVLTAAWSPDGRFVASGGRDRLVKVWNAATGQLQSSTPTHDGEISHVEFNPGGEHLVTASRSTNVRVWRALDGVEVAALKNAGGVRHASFSPDGRWLLTSGTDHIARIWDWRAGREERVLPHRVESVVWVGWSADGQRALTAGPSRMQVWDTKSGEPFTPPLPHTHTLTHGELSADGTLALGVSLDGTARLWKLPVATTPSAVHKSLLRAFGPDGRHAVVHKPDGAMALWDLRERREIGSLPAAIKDAYAHAFDDPTRRLALYRDGKISIHERATDAVGDRSLAAPFVERASWTGPERCSLRLSQDGRLVALFGPPEVRIFEALTGNPVGEPLLHRALIRHVAFSPDGRRLLSVSDDSTARVWEIATGRPLTEPMTHDDVIVFGAFSPDGEQVVTTGYDGTARVWDAATGRTRLSPLRHGGLVLAAEFSADKRLLVTVAAGNQVRVWSLADGRPVTPPLDHSAGVHYATFLDDQGPLMTVTDELAFQLWELPSGQPLLAIPASVNPATVKAAGNLSSPVQLPAQWWRHLPAEDRPIEQLELWSLLLSGQVVAGEGGSVPVEVDRLRRAWAALRTNR